MEGSFYLLFYLRFLVFLKFIWRYISDMKNIKNRKLFSETEQEFEEGMEKKKGESMCVRYSVQNRSDDHGYIYGRGSFT